VSTAGHAVATWTFPEKGKAPLGVGAFPRGGVPVAGDPPHPQLLQRLTGPIIPDGAATRQHWKRPPPEPGDIRCAITRKVMRRNKQNPETGTTNAEAPVDVHGGARMTLVGAYPSRQKCDIHQRPAVSAITVSGRESGHTSAHG
jgi:hypothetical protein